MDTQLPFTVDDPVELLVLLRMICESKFHANPNDSEIWGSPHAHSLARRVSDALLEADRAHGNPQLCESHRQWLATLPNNTVLPVVKQRLRQDARSSWWPKRTHDWKLEYVQGCVAPFEATPEFLEGLLREAEA